MRLRQTKAATALEGGTCGLAWCPVGASVYPRPVAAAPELAATRRPLREAKRQPLIEDRDVRPRDLHAYAGLRPCLLEIHGSANGHDCLRA